MIAFVLPTRDRPTDLERTLAGLGALGLGEERAEVMVVDNASAETPEVPARLSCGAPVTLLRRPTNEGAAARNAGVEAAGASRSWIVMLDDDSHPVGGPGAGARLVESLATQPEDVFAVTADIHLSPVSGVERGRERGGLPEVFVGCGVAIRRDAFVRTGGYDPSFGFYAEEYDLSAKLIAGGGRIVSDPAWRVVHHKSAAGRDMDLIVERLVRNNGWVMQRYAPEAQRDEEVRRVVDRCRHIAEVESAGAGFDRGIRELEATIDAQVRTPLTLRQWERFTGMAAARTAVGAAFASRSPQSAALVVPGKNAFVVERALKERGIEPVRGVASPGRALVIGTLSPGPMADALELLEPLGRRVVAPWVGAGALVAAGRRSGAAERDLVSV